MQSIPLSTTERQIAKFSIPLWLLWCVVLTSVFIGLGSYGLLNNNEGLYAGIPREMIASGDWRHWIIPHLNGLPYMEKPPLLYWLTALSFLMFGASEWSARLVPVLSSLACVAMMLWFGRHIQRPQAGRLAAIMFATGLGVFAMSRSLMFDMLLTALLTAALMLAYRARTEQRSRFLCWSCAFLALAVLAKGFVALILFGLVVLAFDFSISRSLREFVRGIPQWFAWRPLAVFLLVAAPWHIAASLTEPEFAWFYFVNEHVLRFLGKREPHDYYGGPWWYYLPRMALYLFPWSLLLPCLLVGRKRAAADEQVREQQSGASGVARTVPRFLLSAWLLPLCFFSISSAKANYYLVAVMPFAALQLALALERRSFLAGPVRALPGLLISVLAAILCLVWLRRTPPADAALHFLGWSEYQFVSRVLIAMVVLALLCAVVAWRSQRIGILAYLGLPILTTAALMVAVVPLEPEISARPMAQYLQREAGQRQIYLYRNFEDFSSLAFYLKREVPIIQPRSADLFWGDRLRPGNPIMLEPAQFVPLLQQQKLVVVVLDRQLEDFRATGFFDHFRSEKKIGNATAFFN